MDAERWKKVDDLLQAALQQPADQQEAFLQQACAGNAALIEEVRSLLASHHNAGSFLEEPAIRLAAQAAAFAATPPPAESFSGQTVSHYRVLGPLGSGGMGVVYQAEDIKLGRKVALKFLPSELASNHDAFERLQREARAASALDHPNICSIYELGEHEGQPFIAMQLLEGQTLREWIENASKQDPRMRLNRALDFSIQVADGLEAAHQKNVIHRDIKPANIFITTRGNAKILDFGLAKLLGENAVPELLGDTTVNAAAADPAKLQLTRTGTTMGTAHYMSPEQVRGEKLDGRTDLFSLGLVLYEMVAGQRAFAGDTGAAVYDAILHREPTPVRQLNPTVPAELERILNKALAKDRTQRCPSAGQLSADLQSLRRSRESRRYAPLYVAAAALVVLVLSLTFRWWKTRPTPPRPPLNERELTHQLPENHLVAQAISADGKYEAYADARGVYIGEIDSGKVHDLPLPAALRAHVWCLGWFPDGQRLVIWAEIEPHNDTVWSVSVSGGAPVKLRDDAMWPAVSPDGSSIAFVSGQPLNGLGHEIWVMGPNGENPRKILGSEKDWFSTPAWSPKGRRIAYFALTSNLRQGSSRIQTTSLDGIVTDTFQSSSAAANGLVWAPDGRLIFALQESPSTSSYNLWSLSADPRTGRPSGTAVKHTHWDGIKVSPAGISADGTRLIVDRERAATNVYLGELKDNGLHMDPPSRLTLSESFDIGTAWTRDSKALFFSSNRTHDTQIYRQDIAKETPELLIQSAEDEEAAELTPDGKWILYWSAPSSPAGKDTFVRLMRFPVAGGSPAMVLQIRGDEDGDFHCPSLASLSCVLRRWQQGHLIFYALDPLQGQGRELGRTAMNAPANLNWTISPQGQRIALTSGDQIRGQIRVLDLGGGAERNITLGWRFGGLAWTVDGKSLFVSGRSTGYVLARVDLDGKTHVLLDRGRGQMICCPLPSPDGRYLSFGEMNFMSNAWLLENF